MANPIIFTAVRAVGRKAAKAGIRAAKKWKKNYSKRPKGASREDMIPDINPNEYGYGTMGMRQSVSYPKNQVKSKIKKNLYDPF